MSAARRGGRGDMGQGGTRVGAPRSEVRAPRVLAGSGEAGGSRRAERVAGEIALLLGTQMSRSVRDPRLARVMISRVRMTPDLRTARVWFSLLSEHDDLAARDEAARALHHAVPFFRHEIAQALGLRFVPELQFAYDQDLERARRITTLIRSLEPQAVANADAASDATDPDDDPEVPRE